MKRILLINVMLTAFTAMAGPMGIEVPKPVIYEFRKHFGIDVTVRWEKIDDEINKNLFVGHFIQSGIWSEAYFDESGEFIGIGKNITIDQLPGKLRNVPENKFKGYAVMEVYEYFPNDAAIPVYGLTITNEKKTLFLKISESGYFSIVKQEKYKN